jgi:pimeloyl-ACP methyl ester carboxylesterase
MGAEARRRMEEDAMALPDPVIVVPGITATYLRDDYPLPPEMVWKVLSSQQDFDRVTPHPDDPRFEAKEPAVIRPGQLYEVAYKELLEELRYNLTPAQGRDVPVYPFGYDWRKPLDLVEVELDAFIDEVIERTALTRHYYKDGYEKRRTVTLVGHSMGGLIIAGFLDSTKGARKPKRPSLPANRVAKVVTLATPFRGSLEAVVKMATGTANLGTSAPSSREREAARLTPALYHLLPSFAEGLTFAPGLPTSLYDPGAWQPSTLASITAFVERTSRVTTNVAGRAERLFQALLDQAKAHRERLESFRLGNVGLMDKDWLAVVGIGADTRTRLAVSNTSGGPVFAFDKTDMTNIDAATGDGTVPFLGAIPSFLGIHNLVCVSPDDYGYWEVQDRVITAAGGGFHGILPNMDMLHRLIVRFVTGANDPHGKTWGRPAPGVAKADWKPPIPDLRVR